MADGQFILIEEQIIVLLFIATMVGIAARRLRMPYTVGLVIVGLALTLFGEIQLPITSDLILGLLVPPLVFEAAYHLNFEDLRRNLRPILFLTVPGVLITAFLVAAVITWGAHLDFKVALLFGTLVAATDPDAVVALIRSLGVPKRLQVLLEGESLLNDGTVIVLFSIMLGVNLTGDFDLLTSLADFFSIAGGGLAAGFVMGWLLSQVISRIDDHLLETALTSVLAYGAYLFGESIGVSGVMAVVAAGLVNGNIGARGMSPTTRIVVFNFWEYAAFLATTFIFLIIGLQIDVDMLLVNWQPILWAITAVLLARFVVVYGLRLVTKAVPLKWRHLLFWGGLRGALAPALALSLPEFFGELRTELQAMVFGVVLFNLLVQGATLGPLVRRLKLVERSPTQDEYERRHARAVGSRAALTHLQSRYQQGLISAQTWQSLARLLEQRIEALSRAVSEVMNADPKVETEELDTAWREALLAKRSTYASLLRDGIITEDTFEILIGEVDQGLTETTINWGSLMRSLDLPKAQVLLTAFIHDDDHENAVTALTQLGVSVTRLPSRGGLLRQRSVTLLIGVPEPQVNSVLRILESSCQRRVQTTSGLREFLPIHLPGDRKEVEIGGATVFSFEIERYEEI